MDVNDIHHVADSSSDTYRVIADLIEGSVSEEQLVYRECELDELWRILQFACGSGDRQALVVVEKVHDAIAGAAGAIERRSAAQALRALAERS